MSHTITPSDFARRTMETALDEMRRRMAAIEPLIAEYEGLKRAIAAQETALRKIPTATRAERPQLPATTSQPTSQPASPPVGRRPPADAELGTVKEQIFRLLSRPDARRGVAGAVIARNVKGAEAKSVLAQLSALANDPSEPIVRPGRGFYRLVTNGHGLADEVADSDAVPG